MSGGNEKARVALSRASPSKQSSASGTAGKSTRHQNQGDRFGKRGSSVQSSQGKKKTSDGEVHTGGSRTHKQQSSGRFAQSPSPKEGSDKGGSAYDSGGVQGGREEVTVIEHCGKKGGGRSYQKSKQFDQAGGSRHVYKTLSFDSRKDPHKGSKVNHSKAGPGRVQPKTVPQICEDDPQVCVPDVDIDKGTLSAFTSQCAGEVTNDAATVVEGDCRAETPDSGPEAEAVASTVALSDGAAEENSVAEEEREEDEGLLEEKMRGITYTRDFLVSKKYLLESSEVSNSIRLKLMDLGILKGCEAALTSANPREADPRMSAKVALTPQGKSFGGGCSWRNKAGGSEAQEGVVDGGQSSLMRREEAGMYAFKEDEADKADNEYCFGRAEYNKAAPYLGHAPLSLPSGVDRSDERTARTPRKIDHVPLRDQARREAEDYEEGREQQRRFHQQRSFDEPEWMTFDLGSSDEKFEFGGCDEIERMRNEMKAKLDTHQDDGDDLRDSSSTDELTAAKEEPAGEGEAPQFIEAWDELDEDDALEGEGAIRQNDGTESVADGIGGISGAVEERGGMGLTDDVLTQLLGFQLDDPEEDDLQQGDPQEVPPSAMLAFTDYYRALPEANPQGSALQGAPPTGVPTVAALAGSNPSELLKQMLNIQGNSMRSGIRPAYPDVVAAQPQQYGHTHIPNERGHPPSRVLMLDEIEDGVVRDHTGCHASEEEVSLLMARLVGATEGLPPGGQPNRMQGMYPPGGIPPLREPVMDCYNRPLPEPMMDSYHLPPPPPSGVMGQYYRHLQPNAMAVDLMKSGTAHLDHFARSHQQSNAERQRAMLVHAAQMHHQHPPPPQPMGQHGIPVHPHFRQSGSMGLPQQQPRHAHHHHQQGGGKANHMGFMPTSVLRKMASQSKPETLPAVEGPSHMWQAASVANVAKLEQDLAHKAVKTHETMSDLLTSATAMGFVANHPQHQQQLASMEEEMEILFAAAAASGQSLTDFMSALDENSLHPHQRRPMEAYNASLSPLLPGHHNHQQRRVHHQGHARQQMPRPASYMEYM